jgi:methionyl-tRNA synthetase
MSQPTLYINVFQYWHTLTAKNSDGVVVKKSITVDMPQEQPVAKDREEAVRHAEEFADYYAYTLTDTGVIDLTSEFSEAYQERRDYDAMIDAKIDERKEGRLS